MPWWCDKHKQHSCDEVCWQCDNDHDQPYIDAFNSGWDARHEVEVDAGNTFTGEASENKKAADLLEWKIKNKSLLHTRLRGTHD